MDTYRTDLSRNELIDTIRALVAQQRVTEWLVCRYLADFADKLPAGYSDIYHAARCHFGMSVRKTRERLRVGRALRELPRIEKAFVDGALSYSRVREVTRAATPETELQWLELARQLTMRTLERRVAEAGGRPQQDERTDEPADVGWTSPETLEVRLHLRAETWALLQRAMEGARRLSESDTLLSDAEALEAIARRARTPERQRNHRRPPHRRPLRVPHLRTHRARNRHRRHRAPRCSRRRTRLRSARS